MTLRAADLRFVLPHPVATATVLDASGDRTLGTIADGLRSAGVPCARRDEPVDLVVAAAEDLDRALDLPARSHLLMGLVDPRLVRLSGRVASQLFMLGGSNRPTTVVPSAPADALHYYLSRMAAPAGALRRIRVGGAAAAVRSGVPVSRLVGASRVVTVLVSESDRGALPRLVSAAHELGAPLGPRTSWVLSLGRGDDLQRAVFHVLDQGRVQWVVKFSRVRGAVDAFERDEVGLGLAQSAGRVVAAHAPSLLGRFEVDGLPGSVETAAAGRPLVERLARRPGPLVDSIARWILDMGVASATPPGRLAPERTRLAADVLPSWVSHGAPAGLVWSLPPVPGVMQHNDLGSWNIVTDGREFTVVDWESARAVGMPLWDLLYYLADALVRMEGPADVETLEQRCLALFRGSSPYSSTLFGWVRLATGQLGIPPEAVGPLATLCWMHHGLSATLRQSALGGAPAAEPGHLARLAAPWLADRDLGPTWSCWTAD